MDNQIYKHYVNFGNTFNEANFCNLLLATA